MINLNVLPVLADAKPGTLVGTLSDTDPGFTRFSLVYGAGGRFTLSGNQLMTAWTGVIMATSYTVIVFASGGGFPFIDIGFLTINVIAPSRLAIVGDPVNVVLLKQPLPPR